MADSSPLAGLLDQAGNVFSLAEKLGRAFSEQRDATQRGQAGASGWEQHAPTFDEFWNALLELRDAMQTPPDGFGAVAKQLLEAARIAKGIRKALPQSSSTGFPYWFDFFVDLNTVWRDGWQAIQEVTKAHRLDDPFAFIDDIAARESFTQLDRFPATAEGQLEFLQIVGNDLCLAAEAKRGRLDPARLQSTLARMVGDVRWTDARARAAALKTAYPVPAGQLSEVLARELSIATVDELDVPYGVAIATLFKAIRKPVAPPRPAELEITDDGIIRLSDWAQHGILLDEIFLGPAPGFGNTFPISSFDAIVVDGDTPTVCPKTDRPVPVDWLPDILEPFKRFGMVKPGQTIHWVGSQSKLEHVCRCFRNGSKNPGQADVSSTVGDLENAINAGALAAEIDARFGDAWIRIHAAIRKLFPSISTRIDVTFRDGLRAWIVSNYRPAGHAPTMAELRVLKLAEVADLFDSASENSPSAATAEGQASTPSQVSTPDATPLAPKPKRSTERGEGLAKLVAALTKHHQYADGGCLNLEPIGNNKLAEAAEVSVSTASAFFNKNFEGHAKYRAICRDKVRLVAALKLLNQEFAPHHLFGRQPPGEAERGDEE